MTTRSACKHVRKQILKKFIMYIFFKIKLYIGFVNFAEKDDFL